ncbi:MAG: response regulator, partial [Planctomycetota bacterium]
MRPSPPREPERPHVLVVDDEPEIRDLLRTVLTREGYRVTIRGEANAALEDLRDGDHVLLITDLKMPRMSGLDLIRAARNLRPDLGSILITGFASTETAVEALRLGADDFLPKPFQIDVLRRVVDRVLQRRRMLTQERDALDLARGETEALRRRSRETRTRLESVERDLALSPAELQPRVRDLDFMGDLTSLLAREDDVTRVLATTVRILAARFSGQVVRIEVAGPDGVHIAEHVEPGVTRALWASLGPHLVGRARGEPDALVRETLLADGRPWEAFAATVELAHGPAGSMTLLREAPREEDPGDRVLFGLVRRALAVGLD